jgi:hypothetical protein
VREWIRRFNKERIPGLVARRSPGRPRKFPVDVPYRVRAIISDAPSEYGIPKSRWTLADICRIAVQLGLVGTSIRGSRLDIYKSQEMAGKPRPTVSQKEESTKTLGEAGIRR